MSVNYSTILTQLISPIVLDEAVHTFLASIIEETITTAQPTPKPENALLLTEWQDVMEEALSDLLASYDITEDADKARLMCQQLVQVLISKKLIGVKEESLSDEKTSNTTMATKTLKKPICIASMELSEKEDQTIISQHDMQRLSALAQHKDKSFTLATEAKDEDVLDGHHHEEDDEGDADADDYIDGCLICERDMPLTKHHVIPKTTWKKYEKKGYTQDVLSRTISICRPCHSHIHKLHTEEELAANYYNLELILADPAVQKWAKYMSKRRVNRTHAQGHNIKMRYGR